MNEWGTKEHDCPYCGERISVRIREGILIKRVSLLKSEFKEKKDK